MFSSIFKSNAKLLKFENFKLITILSTSCNLGTNQPLKLEPRASGLTEKCLDNRL